VAFIYEFEYTVHSVIENLDDNGIIEGEPEVTLVTVDGFLKSDGEHMLITYAEMSEGGKILTDMRISEDGVKLTRRGAVMFDATFREGERVTTVYSIPPYSFDATLTTRKIRSELTKEGGVLRLHYGMNIGGQEKAVRMKITARPKARK
jgi:uncharacterized beta-barrel protein YwiB (DUF1934 family)